jgi:uncharacterized protein (DUF1778 family)
MPNSEPLVLRITPDLKGKLANLATKQGRSVNQFIINLLETHVGVVRCEQQAALIDLQKRVLRLEEWVTMTIEAEGLHKHG